MKCFWCVQSPSSSAEAPTCQEAKPPTTRIQKDKVERFVHKRDLKSAVTLFRVDVSSCVLRILMPPPPPTFVIPAPVSRKRPREAAAEDPVGVPSKAPSMGMLSPIGRFLFETHYLHYLVRCIKCIPPAEQWGRSGDLSECPLGGTNWRAVLVYVLCLSLCFLSQHARPDLPVVDVWIRCHFIWYLPSRLWITGTLNSCLHGAPQWVLSLFALSLSFFSPFFPPDPSFFFSRNLPGVQEELRETKPKVEEDALGLVPYEGDSSDDEEEERTLGSKKDSRLWRVAVVSPPTRTPSLSHSLTLDFQSLHPVQGCRSQTAKRKIHSVSSRSINGDASLPHLIYFILKNTVLLISVVKCTYLSAPLLHSTPLKKM